MTLSTILKKMLIGKAFSTERGRIRTFEKIDWVLYPSRGAAQILQEVGTAAGKNFLFDTGRESGASLMTDIMTVVSTDNADIKKSHESLVEFINFLGFGELQFLDFDADGKRKRIHFRNANNPITEYGVKMYGSKSMACGFFHGLFTGFLEKELSIKNLRLTEIVCMRKGGNYCEWETKTK